MIVGVADCARQIGSVEVSELYSGALSMKMIRRQLAPDFWPFFETLYGVVTIQEMAQKKKESAQPPSPVPTSSMSTTGTTRKRPRPSSVSLFPERKTKSTSLPHSEPTTPDRPTNPSDPEWTGGTVTSKDEENTKQMLKDLLRNTMSSLEEEFCGITWQRSGYTVELALTLFSFSFSTYDLDTEISRNSG